MKQASLQKEKTPVIAIFDIGKTNKKIFLFNEQYQIIHEQTRQPEETIDEDGFPCEDVNALTLWVNDVIEFLQSMDSVEVKAFNVSAYGASFVYLDRDFKNVGPLYNYLKPLSDLLQKKFYEDYGGETKLSLQTASPVLGNLNSGLQLYRLKYERPLLFNNIAHALHLPQYISYLISSKTHSEMTSIGCHTLLWDFEKNSYHKWVSKENIDSKFPPVSESNTVDTTSKNNIAAGIGLHDSSAALIPYLKNFTDPFVLISTGTWCISLNPFNHDPLTKEELGKDCLCYLSYEGNPVKASRLFAGHEHEVQTKRLATHFKKRSSHFKSVKYQPEIISKLKGKPDHEIKKEFHGGVEPSAFENRDLSSFFSYEEAYHQLIIDIMSQQVASTEIVLKNTDVKRIFVDGGFSNNPVYMNLLASAFPNLEVYGASIPQASALGAALAIHQHWNSQPIPGDLIELKYYANTKRVAL